MTPAYRPPDIETARRAGRAVEGTAGRMVHGDDTAALPDRTVRCACCRRPVLGASPALLGVHAACWRIAGARIRVVSQSELRRERAAIRRWRDAYRRAELRMRAAGWPL